MVKKITQYPMAYLIALVIIYSIYDYFEHISRSGSTFNEHPWYWLLFSVTAVSSFILIVLLSKNTIQKITSKKNLIIEVIAIGIWLSLYISILGPIIDKLFWPFDDLNFSFKFGPIFIILIAYFIIRMVINLVLRKNILYSK